MDETLKAMNNESTPKVPKSSGGQMSGALRGRELVNPSIMQSAPEVNGNTDARLGVWCRSSVTVLSSVPYLLVGGCQWQRKLQEEREGAEFSGGQRERRTRQSAAPRQRAAGDV